MDTTAIDIFDQNVPKIQMFMAITDNACTFKPSKAIFMLWLFQYVF